MSIVVSVGVRVVLWTALEVGHGEQKRTSELIVWICLRHEAWVRRLNVDNFVDDNDFITCNSSLVLSIEGLCSSNSWEFEFSCFRWDQTDDLGINSPSLRPTEPRLHVRS